MARRGFRGIIASMFVIGSAAVGIGVSAGAAGAGIDGHGDKNCKIPFTFTPREATAEAAPPKFKPTRCETLEVTKEVTGTPQASPPPGTEFNVVVECLPHENDNNNDVVTDSQWMDWKDWVDSLPEGNKPPFTTTLPFGPEGGTQSVLVAAKHASECTVSESPPPGCTLTSIDPEKTAFGERADAQEVQEPVVHKVTVTNDCTPPSPPTPAAAAAVAVVQVPRFTG